MPVGEKRFGRIGIKSLSSLTSGVPNVYASNELFLRDSLVRWGGRIIIGGMTRVERFPVFSMSS